MNKKTYQKPVVKKVHLDVRSAVLAVCRATGEQLNREGNFICTIPEQFDKCMNP